MATAPSQARNDGMAWGGNCHTWVAGFRIFATPGNFFNFYNCFIFVDYGRSLGLLVEFYLDFCYRVESSSIFSCTYYLFDSDYIYYERSPYIEALMFI